LSVGLAGSANVEYVPWNWTSVPSALVQADSVRANRTPAAVDSFFHRPLGRALLTNEVVSFFGPADGFSAQYVHTKALGSAQLSSTGGTLRFLLDDGGEVHVWTGNLTHVHMVLRFTDSDVHLVYK
jgi:hypothetical protein